MLMADRIECAREGFWLIRALLIGIWLKEQKKISYSPRRKLTEEGRQEEKEMCLITSTLEEFYLLVHKAV
jgi:hypothetical protein